MPTPALKSMNGGSVGLVATSAGISHTTVANVVILRQTPLLLESKEFNFINLFLIELKLHPGVLHPATSARLIRARYFLLVLTAPRTARQMQV